MNAASEAPTNDGLRNRLRANVGRGAHNSMNTKATSSTAAATSSPTISPDDQPSGLPRMSAKISANSPSENTAVPAQSSRRGDGSRLSSTRANVIASAASPIGTLMKKIDSQLMPSTSTP